MSRKSLFYSRKRKRREHEPSKSVFYPGAALIHLIFEESTLLMGILSPEGKVLRYNAKAMEVIQGKPADVLGKPFWETPWWSHSPEQQQLLRHAIREAARGELARFEATHPSAAGGEIYVDFSIKPIRNEKGKVVLLLPVGHDITDRKRAEASVREAAVKYRIVADNTYNWEFWLSPDGRFIYNSPSCERISGHTMQEFEDDPSLLWNITHPDDSSIIEAHRREIAQTQALGEADFRIIRPDGTVRWLHHVCQPVHNDKGEFLGTRGSFFDITLRREALADLRESEQRYRHLAKTLEVRVKQAVDELEEKNRLLIIQSRQAVMGEMINNIAHQWRQPLNVLGLLVQELAMMQRRGDSTVEFVESNLAKMLEIIQHMSKSIDDFRLFFRPGREKEEFKAAGIVRKTLSLLGAGLTDQNIRTSIEAAGDPVIVGYPNEFSQVLLNLVSNARDAFLARAVPEPLISFRIFSEGGRTVVTVTDNAGGIPEQIIEKIFEPYFTTKPPTHGTGIGLYMCKTIIEKSMNGTIVARNVDGGAEFRIEL